MMRFRLPRRPQTCILLLLGLSGCANYIGIHPVQKLAQPDAFETRSSLPSGNGAWPDSSWVGRFGDAQLVALTREALARNLDLQTASARLATAQAQVEGAGGALLPEVAAGASADRSYLKQDLSIPIGPLEIPASSLQTPVGPLQIPATTLPTPNNATAPTSTWSNQLQALIGLNYELDLWGKNHARLAHAISQGKAAQAEAQQARLTLTVAVTSTYSQLARAYASRDVLEQLARQRQGLAGLTGGRVNAGLDNEIDRSQANESLAEVRLQLAQVDEQIQLIKQQIGALLGEGPDRGLRIARPKLATLPTPPLPGNIPVNLVGRRPDVVSARWKVEAASNQIDVAKAEFYPDVNLSAVAGYSGFGLSDLANSYIKGAAAGPAVTLPVFSGGRLRANLKGQTAQYDAAVASYNQTLNGALTDVASQITSVRAIDRQMQVQTQALRESQRTYALVRQRHDAGLLSDLTLLNAQAGLLAMQQRNVELESRRRDLQIALMRSLGGGFDAKAAGLSYPPPPEPKHRLDLAPHRIGQETP